MFGYYFRLRSFDKLGFLSILMMHAVRVRVEFGAFLLDFEFKLWDLGVPSHLKPLCKQKYKKVITRG